MHLSAPFIKRPIGTSLFALAIAIAGLIAFYLLPVAPLPQIEFPTISVQASLPGASAEVMATSVATPLERQLGWIAGVTEITSQSSLSSTQITVQFDLSRDINGAARDVQAALNAAQSDLPTNLPSNPTYRKVNPADAPILILSLTSKTLTIQQLYDAATTILQQRLSQVEGVGQIRVAGASLPSVRIDVNPMQLNHYGLSLEEVRTAIRANTLNRPKGQLTSGNTLMAIESNDQLLKAIEYRPLIIAYRNQRPVLLSDIATVQDSVEDIRAEALTNGQPSVVMILYKEPSANIIRTIQRINALLPDLKTAISPAITLTTVMDRAVTIRASLNDIELTLCLAIVLVILVTYLFLGDIHTVFVTGIAVPLSLLGTFAIMRLCGFSLDNLSLMALTISTGFVIDDAIVVLENITRHIEAGLEPFEAALIGAKEVGFTVLSMSTSLIAVFLPILLMGGMVGRLFREFSITLSIAILVSLVISLTITPMMCAHLLKKIPKRIHHTERVYCVTFVMRFYARSLSWILDHTRGMILLTLTALMMTIVLFVIIPKGFFPIQDTGRMMGALQADSSTSFQAMQKKLSNAMADVQKDPGVQNVAGFIGDTPHSGTLFITLKPLSERHLTASQIIDRIRSHQKSEAGYRLYLQPAQDIVVGGRMGKSQFQYTVTANTLDELNTWVPKIMQRIKQLPGLVDVNSDHEKSGLQAKMTIDRDTASRLGITPDQLNNTLYDAFGQRQIATLYTNLNQYHVIMEVIPSLSQYPIHLRNIYVKSNQNQMIPLTAFTSYSIEPTLLSVNHQSQLPSSTLTFNLRPHYSLSHAVTEVNQSISQLHLPNSLHAAFQGTAQAFQASLKTEPILIFIALFTVYIVLGILYESTLHPLTILSTLPSASMGALLALLLTQTEFSLIAFIGIILLIGIVKKNAIMMIDFALAAERHDNQSSRDSIYEAALLRLRPILMTTMAAMLGALPLTLSHGMGSELRRPLGIAVIGGLIISQLLTLYSTPVIYLLMDRTRSATSEKWKQWIQHWKHSSNTV